MAYRIAFSNQQDAHKVSKKAIVDAVKSVLKGENIASAQLSLAVVNDETIHVVNRRHLKHDYPTDVISFLLAEENGALEGEIIVSADFAAATAERLEWPLAHELLLYFIHGTLHLCGYDDLKPSLKRAMRARERHYLSQLGIEARYDKGEES